MGTLNLLMLCGAALLVVMGPVNATSLQLNIAGIGEEYRPPLEGRICAIGDMNKDRYTDLIVQRGNTLVMLLQSEAGHFSESLNNISIASIPLDNLPTPTPEVFCAVGDFNGDARPDVMVTHKSDDGTEGHALYQATIYVLDPEAGTFNASPLGVTFVDQPTVLDINGDGLSDVLGFAAPATGADSTSTSTPTTSLYCLEGDKSAAFRNRCDYRFLDHTNHLFNNSHPYIPFSIIFADIDSDMSSELIFAVMKQVPADPDGNNGNDIPRLNLIVYKVDSTKYTWKYSSRLSKPIIEDSGFKYFGNAVVGDFNADKYLEIMVPVCTNAACTRVNNLAVYSKGLWTQVPIDMKGSQNELVPDPQSNTLFRVGDFTLDGYLDLIATVRGEKKDVGPMIIDSVENQDNSFFTRKFELRTSPRLLMPSDAASGKIQLSSFIDLKEDGSLDIMVEYKTQQEAPKDSTEKPVEKTKLDFINCNDKGDTTFLKVQVFTRVCVEDCPHNKEVSTADFGSGIAWTGACVAFDMNSKGTQSEQCQLPQNTHRNLNSPFALFGLGRSPNFVDNVTFSSPQYPNDPSNSQNYYITQVVPNSRILIAPPEHPGDHWEYRTYLTPSSLIIQSVIVITSVCGILLLVIIILHLQERRQDKKERQSQTQRFHFDAM